MLEGPSLRLVATPSDSYSTDGDLSNRTQVFAESWARFHSTVLPTGDTVEWTRTCTTVPRESLKPLQHQLATGIPLADADDDPDVGRQSDGEPRELVPTLTNTFQPVEDDHDPRSLSTSLEQLPPRTNDSFGVETGIVTGQPTRELAFWIVYVLSSHIMHITKLVHERRQKGWLARGRPARSDETGMYVLVLESSGASPRHPGRKQGRLAPPGWSGQVHEALGVVLYVAVQLVEVILTFDEQGGLSGDDEVVYPPFSSSRVFPSRFGTIR